MSRTCVHTQMMALRGCLTMSIRRRAHVEWARSETHPDTHPEAVAAVVMLLLAAAAAPLARGCGGSWVLHLSSSTDAHGLLCCVMNRPCWW